VEQAWHGLIAEESCLRFHIGALRKALGDADAAVDRGASQRRPLIAPRLC
jgi:DNA-binding winged helix-turn-helix (wHTH) protein